MAIHFFANFFIETNGLHEIIKTFSGTLQLLLPSSGIVLCYMVNRVSLLSELMQYLLIVVVENSGIGNAIQLLNGTDNSAVYLIAQNFDGRKF